jgi:hypothetical protein
MNRSVDFDRFKYELALEKWLASSRQRMAQRYPTIPFDADIWPIREITDLGTPDISFTSSESSFSNKQTSFADALRCYMAELVLGVRAKDYTHFMSQFRVLRLAPVDSLFDLDYTALRTVESTMRQRAQRTPSSASKALNDLHALSRILDTLSSKGVLPRLRYRMKQETRAELLELTKTHQAKWRSAKADMLSRSIEALSEAFNALFENDPRLSSGDRVAIATMGLELCAPSRINEILCLSVDDYVTIDDYARRAAGKASDTIHAMHQLLLVTMKGSKGAQWSAKPVLNFMIDLFHYCLKVIIANGERSRMLVRCYQQNHDKLYLPPELEYLRGKDLTVLDVRNIMALADQDDSTTLGAAERLFSVELRSKRFKVPNPNPIQIDGRLTKRHEVYAAHWNDIESLLLEKTYAAMEDCRKVTSNNYYKGDLAKMLFLFDSDNAPYLPSAFTYATLSRRLKQTESQRRRKFRLSPSFFEKLGITMPVNGVTQFAQIESHDPRRWLTTMALIHGEKLSNVLINKWARRLSIAQLWNYDFRSAETKAAASAMPEPLELKDLSNGLTSCRKLEDEYGPKIDIVTVHDAGVSGTTMDAISAATESRPIARTSEQIIIIYPTWYGFCAHQHHEKPCRAYTSCLPCDDNYLVKGHIPTNDRTRVRATELHSAILNILEQMVIVHGREIADNQDTLAQHVHHLVERGLTSTQMADELISRFHDIKHLIKDAVFKNQLHEAFVATGYVEKLDNQKISSGALIKYHNPTHHAAPGVERALDAHGGHEQVERDRLAIVDKYPQFAPTALGLKDQRSLIMPDGDEENDEEDSDE